MYNIYTENKKINEKKQKIKEEKEQLIYNKKHRIKINNLVLNYQKKIKKFILDVSKYNYFFRWQEINLI